MGVSTQAARKGAKAAESERARAEWAGGWCVVAEVVAGWTGEGHTGRPSFTFLTNEMHEEESANPSNMVAIIAN